MRQLVCLLGVLVALSASPAWAQLPVEAVGLRALGMAGAFVAVADDATAVYWNPAGLVGGDPAGATIEWTRLRFGKWNAPPAPGGRGGDGSFTSLGTWPLGLAYGRLRATVIEAGADGPVLTTVQVRQYSGTVAQTIVEGLVLGATIKYLRGSAGSALAEGDTLGNAIGRAADLDLDSTGAFDVDLGLMLDMRRVRVGLSMRNLREPTFGDVAGTAITLKRHARAGLAVLPADGLTLALDVDLDTVDLRGDLRRMIALGGESRLGRRLSARGGLRWNLEGEGSRRPLATAGVSVMVRSNLWVDAYVARGRRDEERGFGVGMRSGY